MKWSSSSLLSALLGVMVGLGIFTFRLAEGFSYFTNDPNACANCHIMRDYLDFWQKSSHHARAACADCHTPDMRQGQLAARPLRAGRKPK